MNGNPNLHCPRCGSALFVHGRETLCPDCTSYTLADTPEPPARYRDQAGLLWQPVALVPWCELTEGARYAIPGESAVHVRSRAPTTPSLWSEYPALARGLHNRAVLLLERVADDRDRILDLVDDGEPPF
jgi:hypothetical protein